jgi:lipid A 3-O-deacylase PagL
MKKYLIQILFFISLFFFTLASFAWDHSIELGYGHSHDPNNVKYNNSGFLLSGDLFPFKRTDWTFWSITGSLGQWYSTAPHNKNLTTAALALALRFYPVNIINNDPVYLLGSVGPAYLSSRTFGTNKQGSNIAFQLNAGFGIELNHQYDVNLRLVHYSNAHLANPDHGYNILYLLSIGYLFC